MSMSPAWMAEKTSSAMPCPSLLMRCGWNKASLASNLYPTTLMTLPSGKVYCSTRKVVSCTSFCSAWM